MNNKHQYLTLGALFCALHLLFVVMAKFLPGSELILVIFLPLLSTIYTLKFDYKSLVVYLLAVFLLCVVFEPIATFIYVVPGLICGSLYGFLTKKKVKELSLVYISSLSHIVSVTISFLVISLLFKEVNFFEMFSKLLNKSGEMLYPSIYLVLVLIGIVEAFALHFITQNELKRFGYERVQAEDKTPTWMAFACITSFLAYLLCSFIEYHYSIYIYPFLLAFNVPVVVEFIMMNKRKWLYFIVGFMTVLSIFLLAKLPPLLYPLLLILILVPFVMEKIVRILYTFSLKYSNNGKNKIE